MAPDTFVIDVSVSVSQSALLQMNLKISNNSKILIAAMVIINCYSSVVPALRKTPKVYNALITTDENLTSSRAYPLIQPTIHESGIAHLPYGPYNPYGFYPPLIRFGQPIAPGLLPSDQITRHQPDISNLAGYPFLKNYPVQQPSQSNPEVEQHNSSDETNHQPQYVTEVPQSASHQNTNQIAAPKKVPIPLNELGLPPSLIPLHKLGDRNVNPINLPPYIYNHYPIIYDPANSYNDRYLPPYDYLPNNAFAVRPIPSEKKNTETLDTSVTLPVSAANESKEQISEKATTIAEVPNFESIKNGSKNKNSQVPDVPPPAIPSGSKMTQT